MRNLLQNKLTLPRMLDMGIRGSVLQKTGRPPKIMCLIRVLQCSKVFLYIHFAGKMGQGRKEKSRVGTGEIRKTTSRKLHSASTGQDYWELRNTPVLPEISREEICRPWCSASISFNAPGMFSRSACSQCLRTSCGCCPCHFLFLPLISRQ